MRIRALGALALLLLAMPATAGLADERDGFRLPGVLEELWPGGRETKAQAQAAPAAPPVQLVQAGDPRLTELQEQVRQLSGTVEELNFQVLQMQEQMRKQQEDFEFRFQELEGGRGGGAGGGADSEAKPDTQGTLKPRPASPTEPAAAAAAPAPGEPMGSAGDVALGTQPAGDRAPTDAASVEQFGTITFDARGNVTGGSVGDQTVISRGAGASAETDSTTVAALPATDNPDELYRSSYEFILAGDYATAEAGFRAHADRFPEDARASDTQFWLGEALLAQNKSRDAAEVFLAANKAYPKAKKAPDMLFKLGVSLKRLNQRDVACATFSEVEKRYPELSPALKKRVAQERTAC